MHPIETQHNVDRGQQNSLVSGIQFSRSPRCTRLGCQGAAHTAWACVGTAHLWRLVACPEEVSGLEYYAGTDTKMCRDGGRNWLISHVLSILDCVRSVSIVS